MKLILGSSDVEQEYQSIKYGNQAIAKELSYAIQTLAAGNNLAQSAAFAAGSTEREQDAEPVAWMHTYRKIGGGRHYEQPEVGDASTMPHHHPEPEDGYEWVRRAPLYTSPPKRKPLTDEQRDRLLVDLGDDLSPRSIVRATERAHEIGDE